MKINQSWEMWFVKNPPGMPYNYVQMWTQYLLTESLVMMPHEVSRIWKGDPEMKKQDVLPAFIANLVITLDVFLMIIWKNYHWYGSLKFNGFITFSLISYAEISLEWLPDASKPYNFARDMLLD